MTTASSTKTWFDRFMEACGKYPALPVLCAAVVAAVVCSLVFSADILHVAADERAQWAVAATVPTWFLVNGALSGLSVGWHDSPNVFAKLILGTGQAVAAILILVGGALYLWLR
jgi:hypothetical protein